MWNAVLLTYFWLTPLHSLHSTYCIPQTHPCAQYARLGGELQKNFFSKIYFLVIEFISQSIRARCSHLMQWRAYLCWKISLLAISYNYYSVRTCAGSSAKKEEGGGRRRRKKEKRTLSSGCATRKNQRSFPTQCRVEQLNKECRCRTR